MVFMKKAKSSTLQVKRKPKTVKKGKQTSAAQNKPVGILSFQWFTKLIGK
jgi:hypothetical protein